MLRVAHRILALYTHTAPLSLAFPAGIRPIHTAILAARLQHRGTAASSNSSSSSNRLFQSQLQPQPQPQPQAGSSSSSRQYGTTTTTTSHDERAMSTAATPPSPQQQQQQQQQEQREQNQHASSNPQPDTSAASTSLPLLEYSSSSKNNSRAPTHTIDLSDGGQGTVKLDHMGPLVVHQDGTMSRISNWAEMSEIERQNTLRIVGKRNQQRLEKLKAGKADGSSGASAQ